MKNNIVILGLLSLLAFPVMALDYQFSTAKNPLDTFPYWKWANPAKWNANVAFENRDGKVILAVKQENPTFFAPETFRDGRFEMKIKLINPDSTFYMLARRNQDNGNGYELTLNAARKKFVLTRKLNKKSTEIAVFHFPPVSDATYAVAMNFRNGLIVITLNGEEVGQVKDDGSVKSGQCGFGTTWGAVIEMISCSITDK